MFCLRSTGVFCAYRQAQPSRIFTLRFSSTKAYDPLRVLFCGSDEFSIASLKALHAEHLQYPDRISSIDVVCRPGKRFGRGTKYTREVPIKAAAAGLKLPIHEIDTFRGWTPPGKSINLIVAVSFGLFVPRRILTAAKYGGLNVHPSLLPDFRGPAPLHHTLLNGRTMTGITLQTLHHEHFDHGVILQQTPEPGFKIPNPDSCTVPQLLELVSPQGADMLVDGIRKGLFVPPLENGGWNGAKSPEKLIHAAKIETKDRHTSWLRWTWQDINRRSRVIGPLWNNTLMISNNRNREPIAERKRIIIMEMEEVQPLKGSEEFSLTPGWPFVASHDSVHGQQEKGLYVWTSDIRLIHLRQIKVEGQQTADGARAAHKARMLSDRVIHSNGFEFRASNDPLL